MFLIDNTFCSEAITVQLLKAGTTGTINSSWEKDLRLVSQSGGGGLEAPKEMIDLFPMADGSKPTVSNGYNNFLFFLDRDPRFYRTFAFSGSKWGYDEDSESVTWAYRWLDANDVAYYSDDNQESSPAFVRKMSNTSASSTNYEESGTDIFEYRYAELLLNIAECYAVQDLIFLLCNTLSYLGKIRNRVGISSANNYGIGNLADKYAAINACLYERRVELAYEGKRFWDIQRWMLYNDSASNNNNTCAKLGVAPINGTQRTGNYLQYKDVVTDTDPLDGTRVGGVDPDDSDFATQLQTLAAFYDANFELVDLETPMDNINGDAAQIDWKQNYYISGLSEGVLIQNTWLEQTIGWKDAFDAEGTFDYQQ